MSKTVKKKFITAPRILIFVGFCFAVLFTVWLLLRSAIIKGVSTQIKIAESQGYLVNHEGLSITGFPFQIIAKSQEISVRAPTSPLNDPAKNWAITLDDLTVNSATLTPLSWQIDHNGSARIDMRAPTGQRYMFDIEPARIHTKTSLKLGGTLKSAFISLDKTRINTLVGTPPPLLGLAHTDLDIKVVGTIAHIEFNAHDLVFTDQALGLLHAILGQKITQIKVQANVHNWGILEKQGFASWQDSHAKLHVEHWEIKWGDIDFTGDLDIVFKDGAPDGILHIQLKDIKPLLGKLKDAGMINGTIQSQAKLLLGAIDENENGRKEIELVLRNGQLKMGPIALFTFR
ncbi:MAG: hypothetical protein COA43_02535 [Robiginitomaculum sp.]|nr:MAG: hypothetical protein COA43_02535 [Robiginitomaculum sp.]